MKIKFGAIVVDGRGKIGGHVMSKNRGGAYMRTKVTPANAQTAFQMAVRGIFTFLSQKWASLTEAQRTAWNGAVQNFAKTDIFGDIKNPSGSNLYLKLNSNLLNAGVADINSPPDTASAPAAVEFTAVISGTADTVTITLPNGPIPANTKYQIEATAPLSAGKNFVKNQFRVIDYAPSAAVSPLVVSAAYIAKFGSIPVGKKVGLRIRAINTQTGLASLPTNVLNVTV